MKIPFFLCFWLGLTLNGSNLTGLEGNVLNRRGKTGVELLGT